MKAIQNMLDTETVKYQLKFIYDYSDLKKVDYLSFLMSKIQANTTEH